MIKGSYISLVLLYSFSYMMGKQTNTGSVMLPSELLWAQYTHLGFARGPKHHTKCISLLYQNLIMFIEVFTLPGEEKRIHCDV